MLSGKFMRAILLAATMSSGAGTALADQNRPAYDRRIEEAAIERVQSKLGDIRGPLGLHAGGHFDPTRPSKPTDPWVWLEFTPPGEKISG